MSVLHKIKKGTTGAAKGAVDGLKQGLSEADKELNCMRAINDVKQKVMGLDPRTWMKSCAKCTLFQMKGPDAFIDCLENKLKTEIYDIEHPRQFAESLWNEIKDSCAYCIGINPEIL